MIAAVFPGQASQYVGMGKELFENHELARIRFEEASDILGFDVAHVMIEGSEQDLKETRVTQPAVFLHSVITAEVKELESIDAVAGHSLGEFSALVANKALGFADGLLLVKVRAESMQKACEAKPGTMAAIVGLDDTIVEDVCESVEGIVIAANYNCPGQLVISGEMASVEEASRRLTEAGAKRAIVLPVGGAFHSPLMAPAGEELAAMVNNIHFQDPVCPIYQNASALPSTDPEEIKRQLILQLTSPVRWTSSIQQMIEDGVTEFVEVGGTGKVLRGMIRRIDKDVSSRAL